MKMPLLSVAVLLTIMISGFTGCAGYYVNGDPDPNTSDCETQTRMGVKGLADGACRFIKTTPLTNSQQYITASRKRIESLGGGLSGLIFMATPIGLIAPIFGYPYKSYTYSVSLLLHISPKEAAEKFSAVQNLELKPEVPAAVLFDFNKGADEEFQSTGQTTFYTPGQVKITILCHHTSCSASSEPSVLGSDGTLNLSATRREDKALVAAHKEQVQRELKKRERERPLIKSLVETFRGMTRTRLSNELMATNGHAMVQVSIKGYQHEWLSEDHRSIRVWGTASASAYLGEGQMTPANTSSWSFEARKSEDGWTVHDTTSY